MQTYQPSFVCPQYNTCSLFFQHNDGQTGGEVDVDLNVVLSWKNGYTGVNITICILDDGIDHTHPDIKDNYVSLQMFKGKNSIHAIKTFTVEGLLLVFVPDLITTYEINMKHHALNTAFCTSFLKTKKTCP